MSTNSTVVPESKLPLPAGKQMPQGPAANIAAVEADQPDLEHIAIGLIIPSQTNPRRKRNPERDAELLESVHRDGVLQPIMLRPIHSTIQSIVFVEDHYRKLLGSPESGQPGQRKDLPRRCTFGPGEEIYEIIAGQRRWEAAVKAGKATIPAVVRKVKDDRVLYLQIIENLQREDISPIDEGRGFRVLLSQGKTAQEIADQVSVGKTKSARYIYARAKLVDLIPGIQSALETGRLSPGHGDLLVRLQHEGQKRALRYIEDMQSRIGQAPVVRALDEWIKNTLHISLDSGPWKKDDATLVPEAGACSACQKNSAVNPEVFPEAKRATCIDSVCFSAKLKAWSERQAAKAKEQEKAVPASKPASRPPAQLTSRFGKSFGPTTVQKLGPDKKAALTRALHHFADADKRWGNLVRSGATDAQIKVALGAELGDGGSQGPGMTPVTYKGGTNPAIWFGASNQGKPHLHGAGLIAAVRELLAIPTPEQAKEAAKAEKLRARSLQIQQQRKRAQELKWRIEDAVFVEVAKKATLDPWMLRTIGPDVLFEAWHAGLRLDHLAQFALNWPKPKNEIYDYKEVKQHVKGVNLTANQVIAMMVWMYSTLKFPEVAKHFKVNPARIRQRVSAEMRAEVKARRKKA